MFGVNEKKLGGKFEVSTDQVALDKIENALKTAWTGAGSTPFLADAPISSADRNSALQIIKAVNIRTLFERAPTLATWAILVPLADSYGVDDKQVYAHISAFVGTDWSGPAREHLKTRYRRAARTLGLPLYGNMPTELFFAPLGPARAHHRDLANAFVSMALYRGPPAIEDTSAAREWQRSAVAIGCANIPRLRATIQFDASAYCAQRFNAWRKGRPAIGSAESSLFEAYDAAASYYGRTRTDILGPPRLFWTGSTLALKAERSNLNQTVEIGPFPSQLPNGGHLSLKAPWPETTVWRASGAGKAIQIAPVGAEVLVFDEMTGELLSRLKADDTTVETSARRLVAMSRMPFIAPSFGASGPSADTSLQIAWVESGEMLSFVDRPDIILSRPSEASICSDSFVLGRDGPLPLLACDGYLSVQLDPEVGGRSRILRARLGSDVRFSPIVAGPDGAARIPFAALGLERPADPCRIVFEVLAPGAAGDLEARAELSTSAWIWPGVKAPTQDLENIITPSNYVPARSAGLIELDGRISVNPRSNVETPIIGILDGERVREVCLKARQEKLWHYRVVGADHVFVPKGRLLFLGHANRHDSLRLRSTDRQADLLVLGKRIKRPFFAREIFEITAEMLEEVHEDDRIALLRSDGVLDVLARIRRTNDQGGIDFKETPEGFGFEIHTKDRCDALRIHLEPADGANEIGDIQFGRRPVDYPKPQAVKATLDPSLSTVAVEINARRFSKPSRIHFSLRKEGNREFHTVVDDQNIPLAIAIPGLLESPTAKNLERLASFLAMPSSEWLGLQLRNALTPAYEHAVALIGVSHMVTPVRSILNIPGYGNFAPQHDLVGVAPWLFEANGTAFSGLKPEGGLVKLSEIGNQEPPTTFLDPTADTPLSDWLKVLSASSNLPRGLRPEDLQNAFKLLRFRLDASASVLKLNGPIGLACRLISKTHIEGLQSLRSFDHGGGADPFPAEIVATLERFARACARGKAASFVEGVCFRTGLDRQTVGQVLTLMLRAAIEAFVHFRSLWGHLAAASTSETTLAK